LAYGINTQQENPEELFLSDQKKVELDQIKKDFEGDEIVFITGIEANQKEKVSEFIESQNASFSDLSELHSGFGIIEIPPMKDKDYLKLFNTLETTFPPLTFGGDAYTNAHLAGMAIKIQEILFPIVFVVIYLGLFLVTKNISVASYLFFSSLLGSSLGLGLVKFLYGHSTILTTLTPLIGFILTLGAMLHVVYGLRIYKDLKLFINHKRSPLLLMMITTIIGLASLATSHLPSIRQLALSSSLTLTLTWLFLLLLVQLFPPISSFKTPEKSVLSFSNPKAKPLWGHLILLTLLLGGILGLIKMPILVDAIHFFPKDHLIQKGYENIKKDLGGTPQLDIIVKRKDLGELTFDDYKSINLFENLITQKITEGKKPNI
jgi:predicted RND superfamily exporter protein